MLERVVLSTDYVAAGLLPIVVGVVVNVVAQVLVLTVVGGLLVQFVMFYGQVPVFRMFGLAFASQVNAGGGQAWGVAATV